MNYDKFEELLDDLIAEEKRLEILKVGNTHREIVLITLSGLEMIWNLIPN